MEKGEMPRSEYQVGCGTSNLQQRKVSDNKNEDRLCAHCESLVRKTLFKSRISQPTRDRLSPLSAQKTPRVLEKLYDAPQNDELLSLNVKNLKLDFHLRRARERRVAVLKRLRRSLLNQTNQKKKVRKAAIKGPTMSTDFVEAADGDDESSAQTAKPAAGIEEFQTALLRADEPVEVERNSSEEGGGSCSSSDDAEEEEIRKKYQQLFGDNETSHQGFGSPRVGDEISARKGPNGDTRDSTLPLPYVPSTHWHYEQSHRPSLTVFPEHDLISRGHHFRSLPPPETPRKRKIPDSSKSNAIDETTIDVSSPDVILVEHKFSTPRNLVTGQRTRVITSAAGFEEKQPISSFSCSGTTANTLGMNYTNPKVDFCRHASPRRPLPTAVTDVPRQVQPNLSAASRNCRNDRPGFLTLTQNRQPLRVNAYLVQVEENGKLSVKDSMAAGTFTVPPSVANYFANANPPLSSAWNDAHYYFQPIETGPRSQYRFSGSTPHKIPATRSSNQNARQTSPTPTRNPNPTNELRINAPITRNDFGGAVSLPNPPTHSRNPASHQRLLIPSGSISCSSSSSSRFGNNPRKPTQDEYEASSVTSTSPTGGVRRSGINRNAPDITKTNILRSDPQSTSTDTSLVNVVHNRNKHSDHCAYHTNGGTQKNCHGQFGQL